MTRLRKTEEDSQESTNETATKVRCCDNTCNKQLYDDCAGNRVPRTDRCCKKGQHRDRPQPPLQGSRLNSGLGAGPRLPVPIGTTSRQVPFSNSACSTHTHTHTHTHARPPTRTHARTHACTHTHAHTHARTYTHDERDNQALSAKILVRRVSWQGTKAVHEHTHTHTQTCSAPLPQMHTYRPSSRSGSPQG